MTARGLMCGEVDALDFVLAEKLGMTLAAVRSLPNSEIVEWRQFYEYRAAMADLDAKTRRSRRG